MRISYSYIAFIILIVAFCIFSCVFSVSGAYAPEDTTIVEMSEESLSYYQKEFSLSKRGLNYKDYENQLFFSFDVSADEKIALLFNDATVVVSDKNGKVENVLKFDEDILNTTVRSAAIKWNGDNLELMLGYDVACVFSIDGHVLDIWQYEAERSTIPNPSKLTVSENTYQMRASNFFIRFLSGGNGSYDKLIKISADGNEKILFESNKKLPAETVFLVVFILIFHITVSVVLITIFVIKKKGKLKIYDPNNYKFGK